MKLGLILTSSLFVAGNAFAQAPGDDAYAQDPYAPPPSNTVSPYSPPPSNPYSPPSETVAPPSMTPVSPPPAPVMPPAPPPERDRKWSVGLGIGGVNLAPHATPDAGTSFSLGMLALRYRPWRHLELEVAVAGGSEQLEDGQEGREITQALLAARWRFNPRNKWNFWAMAGIGGMTIVPSYATDEERSSLGHSTLQFGGGIERRFRRFALQAELRIIGVAPVDQGDEAPMATVGDVKTGTMEPIPPSYTSTEAGGWKGGSLTITGNYYF